MFLQTLSQLTVTQRRNINCWKFLIGKLNYFGWYRVDRVIFASAEHWRKIAEY